MASEPPRAPLRERTKERRRVAITDAARRLWRRHGHDRVTMEDIAAEAEVAPATVYNLIGSRERLMGALVDGVVRSVHASVEEEGLRGLPRAAAVIERAVAELASDPVVYRPIALRIPGTLLRHLDARDAARLQIGALEEAKRDGVLRPDAKTMTLGRHVFYAFMGCLYAWACEELGDEDFRRHALLALHATVLPFCTDEVAPRIRREARRLAAAMGPTTLEPKASNGPATKRKATP